MNKPPEGTPISYYGVVFDLDAVYLQEGGDITNNLVLKKDIKRLSLRHGFRSQHPIMQLFLGLILLLGGILVIVNLLTRGYKINYPYIELFVVTVVCLFVAFVLIAGNFLKGFYFLAETDHGKMKLPVTGNIDRQDLSRFLQYAAKLGYPIEIETDKFNIW